VSIGLMERRLDELRSKRMRREQELAEKRAQALRLRSEVIVATSNGEIRADRLQEEYDRARSQLETMAEGIELIKKQEAEALRAFEDSKQLREEADRRVREVYTHFAEQVEAYMEGLEEFIQQWDPISLQRAMQEVQKAEGHAARKANRQLIGNTRAELLFVNHPLLWETTAALAQYQVVHHMMR
jgi:hypothetical protein